jgi:hypothetical protein
MSNIDFESLGVSLDSFDVASTVEEIQNELVNRGLPEAEVESERWQELIEFIATLTARQNLRVQRERIEAYPGPGGAKRRSSIIEGYRAFGQTPTRRQWATTSLRFYLENNATANQDIIIPQYTEVTDAQTGIGLLTNEDAVLNAGDNEVDGVDTVQGTLNEITITSQGEENVEVSIPSDTVAEDGVRVFVGGDEWTQVDSLLEALPDTDEFEAYEVDLQPDETIDILFGDGNQGAIPPQGETIRIVYIETLGPDGRLFGSDRITNIESTINDINGNEVTNIEVTNDNNNVTGGEERQDIDEFRLQAPKLFKAGDIASRFVDINAIARDYPGVQLANTTGERREDPPDPEFADLVLIYVVLEPGDDGTPAPLTDDFVYGTSPNAGVGNPDDDSFLGFFEDKRPAGIVFDAKEAGLVNYYVRTEVFVDPSVSPSTVKSNVTSNLDDLLLYENNFDLNIGDSIRYSQVSDTLDQTRLVEYHHTKVIEFARKNVTGDTSYTFNKDDFGVSGQSYEIVPPFKKETIEIYDLDRNLIASDDGDNDLNPGPNETNFQDGRVNYIDPDPQTIQSDVSSGNGVTVEVEDASVFLVGDLVQISDDNNSEETTVDAVDTNNDTITVDLTNSYTTSDNAQADKLWTIELTFNSDPDRILQFEFQTNDPRQDESQRDFDIRVNENQAPFYQSGESQVTVTFE